MDRPRRGMLAAVGAGVVLAGCLPAPDPAAMNKPAHHTANGFRNLTPVDRGSLAVTLPFFFRRAVGVWRSRAGAPPVIANDGAFVRANAHHSVPTVTWIGHATALVQMDHVSFLTDPIWSATASPVSFAGPRRYVPPGLALDELPTIDFVLISHNHYDHLDIATLRQLADGRTRFLVPLRLGDLLRKERIAPVEELDWWDVRRIGDVEIHCVPSQHWSARTVGDTNRTLWAGWVVRGPTRQLYFAGDTGYFPGFSEIGHRLGPFHLAVMPIGAYEPAAMMRHVHVNPEEAVQGALDARADHVLGVHYGTFDLTDEPLDEPPRRFRAEGVRRGLAADRLWTPAIGETRHW